MATEQELLDVINGRFNYLDLRHSLSQLSGVDCMAATTDEHIKIIQQKLWDQEKLIKELMQKQEQARKALT